MKNFENDYRPSPLTQDWDWANGTCDPTREHNFFDEELRPLEMLAEIASTSSRRGLCEHLPTHPGAPEGLVTPPAPLTMSVAACSSGPVSDVEPLAGPTPLEEHRMSDIERSDWIDDACAEINLRWHDDGGAVSEALVRETAEAVLSPALQQLEGAVDALTVADALATAVLNGDFKAATLAEGYRALRINAAIDAGGR